MCACAWAGNLLHQDLNVEEYGGTMLVSTLVMAAAVALVSAAVLYDKGLKSKPILSIVVLVVLPLIGSWGFNTLANLAGSS